MAAFTQKIIHHFFIFKQKSSSLIKGRLSCTSNITHFLSDDFTWTQQTLDFCLGLDCSYVFGVMLLEYQEIVKK